VRRFLLGLLVIAGVVLVHGYVLRAVWAHPLPAAAAHTTISLNNGWNAVGFQHLTLTEIIVSPGVAGQAFWTGTEYRVGQLTPAAINDAGLRGFWVFSNGAGNLTYDGNDDSANRTLNLATGWNLLAFPSQAEVNPATLVVRRGGTVVALTEALLPQFYEIGTTNAYTIIDVNASGARLRPGRAYWVFAGSPVTLSYGVAASTRMTGKLSLSPVLPVPSPARAELLADKALIESSGNVTISADGAEIRWPPSVPKGWRVKVGGNTATTDTQGVFVIDVPAGITEGQLQQSPASPSPDARFPLQSLVPAGQSPPVITVPIAFNGPCGMDPGQPDAFCGGPISTSPNVNRRPTPQALISGESLLGTKTRAGPHGLYPVGTETSCEDGNGPNQKVYPVLGALPAYLGSTCDKFVRAGYCTSEGGREVSLAFFGIGKVPCYVNHGGRYCQETAEDDWRLVIKGQRYEASRNGKQSYNVTLKLGEKVPLIHHNNTPQPYNYMQKTGNTLKGSLNSVPDDGGESSHTFYDLTKLDAWMARTQQLKGAAPPDATIAKVDITDDYTMPKCLTNPTGQETDVYLFTVQGQEIQITFQLDRTQLYQFDDSGIVFSAERATADGFRIAGPEANCDGLHVHGLHPCSRAPDPNPQGCGHGKVHLWTPPSPQEARSTAPRGAACDACSR